MTCVPTSQVGKLRPREREHLTPCRDPCPGHRTGRQLLRMLVPVAGGTAPGGSPDTGSWHRSGYTVGAQPVLVGVNWRKQTALVEYACTPQRRRRVCGWAPTPQGIVTRSQAGLRRKAASGPAAAPPPGQEGARPWCPMRRRPWPLHRLVLGLLPPPSLAHPPEGPACPAWGGERPGCSSLVQEHTFLVAKVARTGLVHSEFSLCFSLFTPKHRVSEILNLEAQTQLR